MSLDDTTSNNDSTSNDDSGSQYVITFEHDNHSELIIDHELIKVTNNLINEQEHVEELEGGTSR
ncbi:18044_t:CDS:1, partial [Cetraspora pellucida]